jgi:hypothetical protein
MRTDPIVTDLPEEYTQAIGRMVVEWAYLEHSLRMTVYRLLDLDPKRGRIAVRDPRPNEFVKMISELMELAEIASSDDLFSDLPAALQEAENRRNTIIHGIWVLDSESGLLKVIRTSGNWRPDPLKPGVSRKMRPEGIPTTPADIDRTTDLIRKLVRLVGSLYEAIDKALTWPDKSPSQPPTQGPPPESSESIPEPPPESSRE